MIRFDNVTKVYKAKQRAALDNVSVNIDRGEFVFLVGASGSGKSSFLRLCLKEERANSGTVHVAGRDLAKLASWKVPRFRRQMGVVFQDFRLLPNKTAGENIAFALQVIGKPRHVIDRTVPEVLQLVGEGLSNPAVAERLGITLRSTEKHVSSVFARLGLPDTGNENRRVLAVLKLLRG